LESTGTDRRHLGLRVIGRETQQQVVVRLDVDRAAHRVRFVRAHVGTGALAWRAGTRAESRRGAALGVAIDQVVVRARVKTRDAHSDALAERSADRALDALAPRILGRVEHAGRELEEAVDLVERRLARDVLHEAAGRIAAEQRALRTLQHFDALDVEQPERLHWRSGCFVEIDGVRRLDDVVEVVLHHPRIACCEFWPATRRRCARPA
jgi:hypothetical protein